MAIIYTYPQINSSSDLAVNDLMIISDMSANGRPTKSLTLKNLADFVTSTGTGTGTTNKIIKWSDGPAGLLGDSIMNEDVDKIYVDGQLRIGSSSGTSIIQIFHDILDSDNTFSSGGATGSQIIGRRNELYIENRGASRGDIIFKANNGEDNGSVGTYFLLDASMADIGTSAKYTRWPDQSRIVLGNSSNVNNLDFEMYHDSGTSLKNGASNLNITSKGGIFIENESGGSSDIEITQSVTNADINISAYNGNYFRADTSAGATIFSKPVEVPLVPAANANAASKQYVDQQIASIPAGLVFQGNWDASTNTPTLASGTGTVGNYYVVSVAGNTDLDGITDWEVGDWAVFVEVGGVDKWDKIDQTFVQGAGATGQVSFWNGINSVTGDNDLYWDNVNKRLGIGTTSPETKTHIQVSGGSAQLTLERTGGGAGKAVLAGAAEGLIVYDDSFATKMYVGTSGSYDGNVGIGTITPGSKLHIDEAGTISPALFIDTARYGASIIGDGTSNSQYLLNLQSNGGSTDVMRVQSSGNVGIGTNSPNALLHLESASSPALQITDTTQPTTLRLYAQDSNTHIANITAHDMVFDTNNIERMRVTSTGNVGIGTTSPSYKLTIEENASTDAVRILNTDSNGGGLSVYAANGGGGTNRILTLGDASLNIKVAVVENGNVGIGTTSPAAALDVVGRIGLNDGNNNVSVGDLAGGALTTGSYNVAIGHEALSTEDEHGRNIAIGWKALESLNAGSDAYNVAIGFGSGRAITTGLRNTFAGGLAGDALTTGSFNVAFGFEALTSEDTGNKNTAIGHDALANLNFDGDGLNTAVGFNAGVQIITGVENVLIGGLSGDAITTGSRNTVLGMNALSNEDTGGRNTAIGWYALHAQDTGSDAYNTAVGYFAGGSISTGTQNTIIGSLAGDALTTGANNVAVGRSALSDEQAGGRNTAIGYAALLRQNTTGFAYNVAVGYNVGENITTGSQNTLVGGLAGDALTTGVHNVALGYKALTAEDTGNFSVAIGSGALEDQNYSGSAFNVAIGYEAGNSVTTGITNTLIGGAAGDALTTGSSNIVIGYDAADVLSDGAQNTLVGDQVAGSLTSGDENTYIGRRAASSATTGNQNVAIGAGVSLSSATVSNEVNISNNSVVARFQGAASAWTFVSDARDKKDVEDLELGVEFINKLKPRKFKWDLRDSDVDKNKQASGFVAQEIQEILDETGVDYTGIVDTNNPDQYTVAQANIIPMLVKAIQELSAEVKMLKNK